MKTLQLTNIFSTKEKLLLYINNNCLTIDMKLSTSKLKKHFKLNQLFFNSFFYFTNFLPFETTTLKERYYCFKNNITTLPKCDICNINPLVFNGKRYPTTCSKECARLKRNRTNLIKYGCENISQNNIIKEKIKQTNLTKFGVENVFQNETIKQNIKEINILKYGHKYATQNDIVKEKRKKTNLTKYGHEYVLQNEDIKNKMIQTNITKYGVENVFQNKDIKNKIIQTNMKKYNNTYPMQNKEIQLKQQNTCIEKYGTKNVFQNETIKQQIKETNILKYGHEYPIQNNIVKEKIKQTNIEKYGHEHVLQNKDIKSKIKLSTEKNSLLKYGTKHSSQRNFKNMENFTETYILNNFLNHKNQLEKEKIMNYFNFSNNTFYIYKKNTPFLEKYKVATTKQQTEEKNIIEYINTILNKEQNDLNIIQGTKNIIKNITKIQELDIYIPKLNIAIEYNGLMFHSFGKSKYSKFNNLHLMEKNKNNHLIKTNLCEEKGIQLFHINENEWLNPIKQNIWKSILAKKLFEISNTFQEKNILKDNIIESISTKNYYIEELNIKDNNHEIIEFLKNNNLDFDENKLLFKETKENIENKTLIILGTFHSIHKTHKLIGISIFKKSNKNNIEILTICSKTFTYIENFEYNTISFFYNSYNMKKQNIYPTQYLTYIANRRWNNEKSFGYNNFETMLKEKILIKKEYTQPKEHKIFLNGKNKNYNQEENERIFFDSGYIIFNFSFPQP
jgi:hypothetical protein